jgi:hypothetical protein
MPSTTTRAVRADARGPTSGPAPRPIASRSHSRRRPRVGGRPGDGPHHLELGGCLVLPGVGIVLFYALFTPFEARYGIVPFPLAIVAIVTLIARMASRLPVPERSPTTAASAT